MRLLCCFSNTGCILQRAVENERYSNDYAGVLHDLLWMSRVYKRPLSESAVLFRVKITGAGKNNT